VNDPHVRASLDPTKTVVVRACAGSGKTWLLVSRIVRLLLEGAEPSSILALTFTRKASLEMTVRLQQWLREFAGADDGRVRQMLRERHVPDALLDAYTERARTLFERSSVTETGVTIDTFHGWFLQVLRGAPIDAATGAITLLDRESPRFDEAWREWTRLAGRGGDPVLEASLRFLVERYDLPSTRNLLEAFVGERAQWWAMAEGHADPVAHALDVLREGLRTNLDDDPLTLVHDGSDWLAGLGEFADILASLGLKKFDDRIACARNALATDDIEARFEAVRPALFTQSGTPISLEPQAKRIRDLGLPGQRLLQLHERLPAQYLDAREHRCEQSWLRTNEAVFRCGAALLDQYQRVKQRRSAMDFTDIEWRARQLLSRSDSAAFLLHRMDSRYRHLLVDEFQDTNPLQWQSLLAWLDASRDAGRLPTLFVVGDPKQSVYRFRRADSRLFDRAADYLREHLQAEIHGVDTSWRCSPAVLEAVNIVFGAAAGEFPGFERHEAVQIDLPGHVRMLALAPRPTGAQSASGTDQPLRDPLTEPIGEDEERARAAEASAVAREIASIVGKWVIRDDNRSRRAQFRDVMVLTRKRRHVVAFEEAFRAAAIPYVTTRKGGLLDRLEVLDMEALLRFLVTPFSDLDLAHVLRSPLFSATDDDLIHIAQFDAPTWWERLARLCERDRCPASLKRAHALLAEWRHASTHLPVHDLLDRIYFSGEVLERYDAAVAPILREGARANLLALVELALSLDAGRYPSLQRFLDALTEMRDGASQEAPDEGAVGTGEDAVRILTVHGAKGLEAPIVFIVDANGMDRTDSFEVLVDWPPASETPVWFGVRTRKADDPAVLDGRRTEERQAAAREELNALYVAMTRAKQVLFVSGSERAQRAASPTWYERLAAVLPEPIGSSLDSEVDGVSPAPASSPVEVDPRWREPFAAGARGNADATVATDRGERIHWLLEHLTPPRAIDDESLLQRLAGTDDGTFRDDLQAARTILASPALAPFIDPAQYDWARNEVSFVSHEGELRRMDRVVKIGTDVWVLDYKTGERSEGTALPAAAEPHLPQMQAYARAAMALFPGLRVRAALVFAGGSLYEVPAAVLGEPGP
jgi:ATP-dependent helicase/nuclease subunit A